MKVSATLRKQDKLGSGAVEMAEVEFDVKLSLKEVGAAFGIAKIFGDIAASVDFEGDGTALEGSAHGLDALAMRVVEALGNANE